MGLDPSLVASLLWNRNGDRLWWLAKSVQRERRAPCQHGVLSISEQHGCPERFAVMHG